MKFNKIKKLVTIFLIITLTFAGLKYNSNVRASTNDILDQVRLFMEVLNIVKNYYVEEVSVSQLVNGAIRGMLNELDPHTVYVSSQEVKNINENYAGYFDGVGIEFVMQNQIPTVVAPIVGGPSELLGIRPGDKILKIDKTSTYKMSDELVKEKLRGQKGSKVILTIKRPGILQPFKINLRRDRIPIYSIPCYFMIDDVTGYIHIENFSKSTTIELEYALNNLEKMGMIHLILDLRSNSGGLLGQASAVADKFISGGKKIVYTKGRIPNSHEDFYSTDYNTRSEFPVIVLIDQGSASASEIVAGAIQDWDRGLIVGKTSFGKALVQSQVSLSDGSAVRVTVARYYTPCGRLIQRSYDSGLLDYFSYDNEYSEIEVPGMAKKDRPVFKTKGGRVVYGGGGIVPDVEIKARKLTQFTYNLGLNNLFFEYGSIYASKNRELAYNFRKFKANFIVTNEMLAEFRRLILRRDIEIDEKAYQQDLKYFQHQIKSEISRHLWNSQHFYEVKIIKDLQVQGALKLFNKAKLLVNLGNINKKGVSQGPGKSSHKSKKY